MRRRKRSEVYAPGSVRNVVSELGKQLMAGCEIDVKPTFGAPSP
jgi:hypothetical protein